MASDFELFHVTYRLPIFGTDGKQFHEETHLMMICTKEGREDARDTCERFHPGCKVEAVQSQLEAAAGVKATLPKRRTKGKK